MKCDNVYTCSNNCCDKFVKQLGLKIKADNETDTIHGSISIDHGFGLYDIKGNYTQANNVLRPHTFIVRIYTKTEQPNFEHRSTLQKPSKIPTQKDCENCLAS